MRERGRRGGRRLRGVRERRGGGEVQVSLLRCVRGGGERAGKGDGEWRGLGTTSELHCRSCLSSKEGWRTYMYVGIHVPYYKPMMYYKPTHFFSSKFLYRLIDGIFVYKLSRIIGSPPV